MVLNFKDHSRTAYIGFKYIYPVVSRRAEGVSLGINLNPNNACNWRCVYCQVDNLIRGKPDDIELERLEYELDHMLNLIINGDYIRLNAPPNLARFNDICLSGNGESTLSKQFYQVIEIVEKLRFKYKLGNEVKSILITNGSEIDRVDIQNSLIKLQQLNGEIWFKLDRATPSGINQVNQVNLDVNSIAKRLLSACQIITTYIQTCMFRIEGLDPSQDELNAYVEFVTQFRSQIKGVLLYSTIRNPALQEGHNVSSVSLEFLANLAAKLQSNNIKVKYYL